MHPILGRIAIGFVLFLILFPVLTCQVYIIWPWYGRELSVELITLLFPFNVLAISLLWNYYLCIVTDPGEVPDGWKPDTQSSEGYEVKRLTGSPRFCRTCQKFKPPRSHHCKQCNRCVLRMDHHCPWTNNCIGYFNYGHFIRFLFYVDVTCSYHLAMVSYRVMVTSGRWYHDQPTGAELIFIILNYVFAVPVILVVGGFSLYHFHSLMGNTTTIEGWEKDKAAMLRRHGKIEEVKFPYNLGVRRNIASILGNNPLLWCCPTAPPGTGLRYQLSVADEHHNWPPRDPALANQPPFKLPDSPWTYENGDVNPNLRPSNSQLRGVNGNRHKSTQDPVSVLPPYHLDYEVPEVDTHSGRPYSPGNDSDYSEEGYSGAIRVRRGSEGYEVRPVNREQMLQEYVQDRINEAGRYQVYEPEHTLETSDDDFEKDEFGEHIDEPSGEVGTVRTMSDDDVPLALR
ncbi:DHHC palmitoyltransferase-domain-containing protein [Suillus discolor]|uniref:Palmitoyltransferase PFA4 n=1 Tax=Suillus discolor TaxID=1912936 RepID=A0A9P7FHH3_9AGAM|nr:DHHC palmitoyltransferase-domain-containing protein [Suillus discolor]KAG2117985.1 DHHC palmitoyltransferase-domain-containing protein [Suillus discolor]